jgi:flagellar protein FlaG
MSFDSSSLIISNSSRQAEPAASAKPVPINRPERQNPTANNANNNPNGGNFLSLEGGKGEINADDLNEAVEELNEHVQTVQRKLQFSIDEESGRTVIKVLDPESKEVIRQIPPEEAIALARNLDRLAEEGMILKVEA